jgi:glyoxylase-like metal-dependent hydrolase (beta-lactamase superfamily II)
MSPAFASSDLTETKPVVTELAAGLYGYISRDHPNCGFATASDGVLAIDARATPALARAMLADVRRICDQPVRYVVLTHYHAARVMGAAAFPEAIVIASRGTAEWIATRGASDFRSEVERLPLLFEEANEIRGLTEPAIVFDDRLELRFGGRVFELQRLGRGHTAGDSICWAPDCRVAFAGDLVENGCSVYAGDAYIGAWIQTLERLRTLPVEVLVPGHGDVLVGRSAVLGAIDGTRDFLLVLRDVVHDAMSKGADLRACFEAAHTMMQPRFGDWPLFDHVLPFDVARMQEELAGGEHPTQWTAERDAALWTTVHG